MSGFIRIKSRQVMTWTMLNLRRAHHLPYSVEHDKRPLEGRTVVVCGAGPSLRYNGSALRIAQDKRIPVITTNAGDGALRSIGVRPDVVIARESLDLADQVEATEARSWVLDIATHPAQWTALEERQLAASTSDEEREDVQGYWCLPLYPRHLPISRMLGVRPIPAGSSALCLAVTHAIHWGAKRIILAGVDLAVGSDGAVYHHGAPRGTLTATVNGDRIELEGDEADRQRAIRSGQQPQSSSIIYDHVTASDWSDVRVAKNVFQNQREWLETMANPRRHGSEVDCVNASERGSGILGWRTSRLSEILDNEHAQDPWDLPKGLEVDEQAVELTVQRHLQGARHLAAHSEHLLDPKGPDIAQLPYHPVLGGKPEPTLEGAPMVQALAAWKLIDLPDPLAIKGSTEADKRKRARASAERLEGTARAWLQAAEEAERALTYQPEAE